MSTKTWRKTNLFLTDTAVDEQSIQAVVLRALTDIVNIEAVLVGSKEIGRSPIRQTCSQQGIYQKFLKYGTGKFPTYREL